jgi:hypothetical protein
VLKVSILMASHPRRSMDFAGSVFLPSTQCALAAAQR